MQRNLSLDNGLSDNRLVGLHSLCVIDNNIYFVPLKKRKENFLLEESSDVMNSFIRRMVQNEIVVWNGKKKMGNVPTFLLSPTK